MRPHETFKKIIFDGPGVVKLSSYHLPPPSKDELRVQSILSGISAGSERLIFTGKLEEDQPLDTHLPHLSEQAHFPCSYGYCNVGRIAAIAPDGDPKLLGKLVFSFAPHLEEFNICVNQLNFSPSDISPDKLIFLANMETAIGLVMDGRPMLGEKVGLIGAGVVGQLTTKILASYPALDLFVVDSSPFRRSLIDKSVKTLASIDELPSDCHLIFELTGNPQALSSAMNHCAQDGRIVIGSWYGDADSPWPLGTVFHRRRIKLISSQVSSMPADILGYMDQKRRINLAFQMIEKWNFDHLITHKIDFTKPALAYEILTGSPDHFLQICFKYHNHKDTPDV